MSYLSSLTILAMKSRSHADYIISRTFQLKQNLRKYPVTSKQTLKKHRSTLTVVRDT